jgi:FMN phosphatase YigB (HAD superfamily)
VSIDTVTFDCWGTLIVDHDMSAAISLRLDAILEVADGRIDADAARELMERSWRTHHNAWIRGEQHGSAGMARACLEELGLLDDERYEKLRTGFEDAGLEGRVEALAGAADTLAALKEAGLKTALICDAGFTPGRNVRRFLDRHGLLGRLDHLTFSDELGVPKPHPDMFLSTLQALGSDASTSVHVGDLLRTDVHGARAVGMKTVRITAVNDDFARGFSWVEAAAPPPGEQRPPDAIDRDAQPPYAEADVVVASHEELQRALAELGAPLPTMT